MSQEIHLHVVGKNPVRVVGKKLRRGDTYVMGSGGIFELIAGCRYHLFFGVMLPLHQKLGLSKTSEGKYAGLHVGGSVKRIKLMKHLTGDISKTEGAKVSHLHYNTLIITKYGHQCPSKKIAAFDLDNTLICTASGRKFPANNCDWKFMTNVKHRLNDLFYTGYKIVVFTNQAGLLRGKPTKEDFMKKIRDIAESIDIPLIVLAAIGRDVYRKPCIGMWNHLIQQENGNVTPDYLQCFFVGDAAGRLADWKKGMTLCCS